MKVNNTVSNLPVGAATRLAFTVHNLGGDDTFQILAADNRGFISSVQPSLVTLASGAEVESMWMSPFR